MKRAPKTSAATGSMPHVADAGAPVPAATAVVLQAASLLLDYPSQVCAEEDVELIAAALAELPRSAAKRRLERFLDWWRRLTDGERERSYVATFDLDRTVTLYLTEGRPRTSRERGAALLELRRAYRRGGTNVVCDELPDYLPLMLEVAAHASAGGMLLTAERPALEALAAALDERRSPFNLVVAAVLAVLPATSANSSAGDSATALADAAQAGRS